MKHLAKFAIAAVLLGAAVPAVAQPAGAAAASPAKHYNTQETTIGDLLANPAAKAIVDKHIPGFSDNPQIGMVSGSTLRALQPMSPDKLTNETLDAIDADLAKIPVK